MKKNPLLELGDLGQSVWIDFIHRGMFSSAPPGSAAVLAHDTDGTRLMDTPVERRAKDLAEVAKR